MVTQPSNRYTGGRKPKAPGEAYSEVILVRLKPRQMAQLREIVEREGSSLSVWVRGLLLARLAEHPGSTPQDGEL